MKVKTIPRKIDTDSVICSSSLRTPSAKSDLEFKKIVSTLQTLSSDHFCCTCFVLHL